MRKLQTMNLKMKNNVRKAIVSVNERETGKDNQT